jgi:parallel beta-helix repeat protein
MAAKSVSVLQGGFKMKRLSMFFLIVLCWHQAEGDILNVPSLESPTIQSAINDANNGDTIIVSQGSYRENINFLGKAITLTSQDPNNPNIVAATIIDGNQPADPNKGSVVTFSSGEKNNSVLTGFTITGGTGSWLLVSWQYQGLFWNRCGGGAVCYNMSEPTISKNVFVNNIAGQGGGIYVYGDPVNPGNPSNPNVHVRPIITDNTFTDNSAIVGHGFVPPGTNYPNGDHGDGGAIVGFQGCDAVLTGNTLQNNYAYWYGGGIHLRQWSNGLIQNNKILNNSSDLGGGIHITYNSSPTINENTIKQNTARGLGGGGIYIYYGSKPLVSNNLIIQNNAVGAKGGGIGVYWDSKPTIEFNLIAKNTSVLGGGIYSNSGPVKLLYNTIADNSADIGSGICLQFTADVNAVGNIVAANTGSYQIYGTDTISLTASFNDVWNADGNDFGGALTDMNGISGNISKDPLFTSPDNNDFSLTINSPCVNAGDPNFVAQPGQKDINGDDRVIGSVIDIGADEVVLNPLDLNNDGIINCYELRILTEEWLHSGSELRTDFHKDNFIDFYDFAELANQWFWTGGWHQ